MVRVRVELPFKSVLCHVHAFRYGPLPNATHDGDRSRCHLLIELRQALVKLDGCVFQMPGSHRNVPGALDILMHYLDCFCLQTEANHTSQGIPAHVGKCEL